MMRGMMKGGRKACAAYLLHGELLVLGVYFPFALDLLDPL
jgi:hypothetical protein